MKRPHAWRGWRALKTGLSSAVGRGLCQILWKSQTAPQEHSGRVDYLAQHRTHTTGLPIVDAANQLGMALGLVPIRSDR